MPKRSTTPTAVRIGLPLDDIPSCDNPAGPQGADYWAAVAAACKRYPGKWRQVHIDGLTDSRHKYAARDIRAGHLSSFKTGNWDAAMRSGVLYIRYVGDGPTAPTFTVIDEATR